MNHLSWASVFDEEGVVVVSARVTHMSGATREGVRGERCVKIKWKGGGRWVEECALVEGEQDMCVHI